jgi:hypothetical protein
MLGASQCSTLRSLQDYFDNSFHRLFEDHHVLAFFKRSFVQKKESEPQGINRASGGRDLPYSHWPMQHNYYPFSCEPTRAYVRDAPSFARS